MWRSDVFAFEERHLIFLAEEHTLAIIESILRFTVLVTSLSAVASPGLDFVFSFLARLAAFVGLVGMRRYPNQMGEVNGGTMLALVLRFLGGGTLEPAFCTNLPTAFMAERTSSFTISTNPFDSLLGRLRDAGLDGGLGMLTSFVMRFSTFIFTGFRFVGIHRSLFAHSLEGDEDKQSEAKTATAKPDEECRPSGSDYRCKN